MSHYHFSNVLNVTSLLDRSLKCSLNGLVIVIFLVFVFAFVILTSSFSSSPYCPPLNVLHILWGIQPLSGLATFNLHIIIIFMLNIPPKAKIFNSALNQAVFVSLEQFPRICFDIEFLETFSFGYIMTLVLMDCRIPQFPAVSNSAPLENAHANQISVSFQCPSMFQCGQHQKRFLSDLCYDGTVHHDLIP